MQRRKLKHTEQHIYFCRAERELRTSERTHTHTHNGNWMANMRAHARIRTFVCQCDHNNLYMLRIALFRSRMIFLLLVSNWKIGCKFVMTMSLYHLINVCGKLVGFKWKITKFSNSQSLHFNRFFPNWIQFSHKVLTKPRNWKTNRIGKQWDVLLIKINLKQTYYTRQSFHVKIRLLNIRL